jgi:hypothetical protein
MVSWNRPVRKHAFLIAAICLGLSAATTTSSLAPEARPRQQPSAQAPAVARPVGTIKSISGNTITLTTDAGSEVTVQVQDGTKLVRIAPGQKDLKDATPIQLADVQPGDRILVRGKLADDGNSVLAAPASEKSGGNTVSEDWSTASMLPTARSASVCLPRVKKSPWPFIFPKTPSCAAMLRIP